MKELIAQRGALDVDEAIGIMKQLVSAINHAHEHKIIHRDIKPQNVLVKDDGKVDRKLGQQKQQQAVAGKDKLERG